MGERCEGYAHSGLIPSRSRNPGRWPGLFSSTPSGLFAFIRFDGQPRRKGTKFCLWSPDFWVKMSAVGGGSSLPFRLYDLDRGF